MIDVNLREAQKANVFLHGIVVYVRIFKIVVFAAECAVWRN